MTRSFFAQSVCLFTLAAVVSAAQSGPLSPVVPQAAQQAPDTEKLTIKILKGADAVNITDKNAAITPVVQVLDANGRPVAGAVVDFTSPDDGPSVLFINGGRSYSTVTELDGTASLLGDRPMGEGSFQIQIGAKYGRQVATASVTQTNYRSAADAERAGASIPHYDQAPKAATRGLSRGAIAGILVGVAAAAAAGIVLGLHHSGSSSSSTATIGVGNPTTGAPH